MRYGLGSLLLAGGLVLSFGVAYADVLMLTSSAIPQAVGSAPARSWAECDTAVSQLSFS
jgi:hypothetical protein